jgi:hypothetical protein
MPRKSAPSPPSSAHHRRIELQSPQDLLHLQQLGKKAAQARINTAFPQTSDQPEDDELRSRVEQLVDEFLERTYAGVRVNCTANGVPLSSSTIADMEKEGAREEEFEEFDAKLADRIRELERRKEKTLLRVAALRREGVAKAAEKWKAEWERDNDGLDDEDVKMEDAETAAEPVQLVDVSTLKRWDEVQTTHQRSLEGLVGLKSGMASTVGRLEEARRVGEELDGPRS